MFLSTILVGAVALTAGIRAQSTTTASTTLSSTSTSTSSSAAVTHSIATGAEGFVFSPNTVTNASVGDIIEFRFYPTGHSVVRAEYKIPCIPYEDTGPNKVGFYSGFIDVATITNNGPTFSVRVNDTQPIFFYCAAPGSCIDYHMIGVINPNDTETLAVQLEYAKNTTVQMTPGEAMPSETAKATPTPTPTSTSTPGSPGASGGHRGSGLGGGAIAGIAIGGAVVVLLAAALVYLCGRRGGLDKAYRSWGHGGGGGRAGPPAMAMAEVAGQGYHAGGPGPKSPGQETFATTTYSTTPSNDPYPQPTQGGGGMPGYPVSNASPPPVSVHSQGSYQHFGGAPGVVGGPPIQIQGMDNGKVQGGYIHVPNPTGTPDPYHGQQLPRELGPHVTVAPVELPAPGGPGHSGGPRGFSWSSATGGEGAYRPGGGPI